MELIDKVKSLLLKNHNLRKLKDDVGVKASCIRVLNLFVGYGLYSYDDFGNVLGLKKKPEELSNFELLHLIESVIATNDRALMDPFFCKSVQSIDSIGKCWYYPKEMSALIFEMTGDRHNYRKIRTVLNQLVDQRVCIKVVNTKKQSMYRILFTYDG